MEALLRLCASNKTSAIRVSLKSVRLNLQYRTENVIPAWRRRDFHVGIPLDYKTTDHRYLTG